MATDRCPSQDAIHRRTRAASQRRSQRGARRLSSGKYRWPMCKRDEEPRARTDFVRHIVLALAPLLSLLATLPTPRTAGAEQLFSAPYLWYDTGPALCTAIGDLNRDGLPDLAVAAGSVDVLIAEGEGVFRRATHYWAGAAPTWVEIGDLNNDEKADLIVVNLQSNSVSILPGNGDGTFGPGSDLLAGPAPNRVAVGDLNGDGYLDLALANSVGLGVLLGRGDGTFGTRIDYPMRSAASSVAIGDLNGDGRPDLAVALEAGNAVAVLIGNGDGTFGARVDYPSHPGPWAVAIGDVNGDGRLDLAVTGWDFGAVSIYPGRGDGSFGASSDYATGAGPTHVVIDDLNGDGVPDLVTADTDNSALSVLIGSGDGTFAPRIDYVTGGAPYGASVGDLNGDGRPDLAVACQNDFAVAIHLNRGDGTFPPPATGYVVGTGDLLSLALGDLNHDGHLDIVTGGSVLLGTGSGSFEPVPNVSFDAGDVAIADVNGDTWLDLAVTRGQFGVVSVLLGMGDGTFGAPRDFPTGPAPGRVVIEDLNHDSKPDLVVATATLPCPLPEGCPATVSVLLGNGDGTFQARRDYGVGFEPTSVAVVDLNGDGNPDLAVVCRISGVVQVFLGNGDGSFGARSDYGTAMGARCLVIGDFDHDSRPDLAVGGESLLLLGGNGDGTFVSRGTYDIRGTLFLASGDLNGDGDLDLAIGRKCGVGVMLGRGDGSFRSQVGYGTGALAGDHNTGEFAYSVGVGDLNHDGRPDLVVAGGEGHLSVLLHAVDLPTPTTLALVDAHATPERVELRWFGSAMAGASAVVYRRSMNGDWRGIGSITADGTGLLRFEDPQVRAGERYGYRLGIREGQIEAYYGETWLSVPVGWTLTLAAPAPNPATGNFTVTFSLPRAAPARLELIDVAGRSVSVSDVGSLGAGQHTVAIARSRTLRPGVYIIRLTQGWIAKTTRACLIR